MVGWMNPMSVRETCNAATLWNKKYKTEYKVDENDMGKFTLSKQFKLYNLVDNVRFGESWVVLDDGLNGGTGGWGR
mgnify:CR=1 FL=1